MIVYYLLKHGQPLTYFYNEGVALRYAAILNHYTNNADYEIIEAAVI